jgi:hypothetical protein
MRRNPSALAVAREDPLGRVAMPGLFLAAGAAAGIVSTKITKSSTTKSALVGAALGLGLYVLLDVNDRKSR